MFYKKKLFIATLTFTVFLMALFTNAQTIIVVLKQPPPNQWHVEDLWQLTLTNHSLQESYNVYLYGTVEEAGAGLIFESTSATFELLPNISGHVNPYDLEPVDVEYPNSDYEEIILKTGTLPAGTYTICVYVKGVDGEVMGYDCKMQIIAHSSPPELINPADEANVTEELPVFLWLPPMPMNEFVSYTIKIVELMDGQVPIEAIEANPAFYLEEDIPATSFQFSISARPFESGINYAWQIQAFNVVGQPIGNNHGKSEVRTFSVNLEQLVSSLDCDSIRKMLDNLKAQLKAKTKDCLDKSDRLNGLKDNLSRNKNMLNNAKKKKMSLEEKLNKDQTSFNNAFNYLKQILGNEATLIEYSSSGDLKQKALGQNYIGSGGIAIVFSDVQNTMDAFDRYRAVTGESIGACLKNIRKLRKQKEKTKNALQKTENNIQKLNSRITKLQNEISSLSNELKACRDEIKNLRDKIAKLISAYEECELAFNAAMQEAESLIEQVDEMINNSGINLSLDSLDTDLRELQSAIDDCCGTGCECSEMRSSLTQAQEHRQNANEFMKQARAKLKQAKEKVGTDPREANRLAGEASELVRKAKNELKNAKNKIQGLAGNIKECVPGTISNKKTYKRFKITKIVDIGLAPYEEDVEEYLERIKNYGKSAQLISFAFKLAGLLDNFGKLLTKAFAELAATVGVEAVGSIANLPDQGDIVDAIFEAWPSIVNTTIPMRMYFIVEGHYETKETWDRCDDCCKLKKEEGPISKGPTIQKIQKANNRILPHSGRVHMMNATNSSLENIMEQLTIQALWKCE